VTERVTLGTLVTGIGYRNPAHLGKILASLDVLSGGRAVCGLGIGWFEKEATAYGWDFPPVKERYDLLHDTLELLPLLWGPGAPEYSGRVIHVPEAMCYPRPLQDPIPILIGGSGEKKTLRLVAEHADMCNLFGDAETVRHKVEVLRAHCADVDRDPSEVTVTHLSQAMTAADAATLDEKVEARRGPSQSVEEVAAAIGAGSIEDQIGRYRQLADAGVEHAIISLPDASDLEAVEAFSRVLAAFS
jgi:alkanesulfonate monooxygenase SsuD/methylene tetrahydromethanopterin reductase-like flavin-dependent oxidoreductase (luciferase family)